MKLNKHSSYVLIHLLNGNNTAAAIAKHMAGTDIRSIQRALTRLVELELAVKHGPRNKPHYKVNYTQLLDSAIPEGLLEDQARPQSMFHNDLLSWLMATLKSNPGFLEDMTASVSKTPTSDQSMTAKELEYLTVELSWKSSALEGNTYTLLDTQLLLTEGVRAKNRTEFETQMILNHKNAIAFIIENPELFSKNLKFSTLEALHGIIGNNLGIGKGVRKRLIRISASNYVPTANPHQLREYADAALDIINQVAEPTVKALLALALIPYLQIFEDGNKRTGRLLANGILISTTNEGFSLRNVSARQLAMAYLAIYEFNSLRPIAQILNNELAKTS